MSNLIHYISVIACAATTATVFAQEHDDFDHLIEINKASLVMLVEEGLVPTDLAARIASGTLQIEDEQRAEGARRSSNYLVFERRLLELAGPEGSRLHTGRSRQDIGSTLRRFAVREALLDVLAAQHEARSVLLDLAETTCHGRHPRLHAWSPGTTDVAGTLPARVLGSIGA